MKQLFKKFRYLLKALTIGITVRVRSGPLVGMRWSVFTGIRFIRGDYSRRVIPKFLELLHPGDVAYDIGAHIGYYSLCASLKVGEQGQVVAFEPLPLNIKYLRHHVRINHIKNVQLIEAGVSDKSGTSRFDIGLGTGRGHIGDSGGLAIDMVSLDDLCASGKVRPPNLIKMDIEGEETKALRGAKQTLSSYRPIVLISLHGDEARQQCPAILESLGYKVQWLGRSDILATA